MYRGRFSKGFVFLDTVLVRGGGRIENAGSISDGSTKWMSLGLLAGKLAGGTGIGDRGDFWAATVGNIEFPEY